MRRIGVLLALAGGVCADPLTNGSFEDPFGAFDPHPTIGSQHLGTGSTLIPGWTVVDGDIDWVGFEWDASDGSQSIDLNGSYPGTIATSFLTTPGAEYVARFEMAGNPTAAVLGVDAPEPRTMNVWATGGSVESYGFNTTGRTSTDMGWVTFDYRWRAAHTTTTLYFASTTAREYGPALDNVRVESTPVPEPAALLLVSAALLAFAMIRRWR